MAKKGTTAVKPRAAAGTRAKPAPGNSAVMRRAFHRTRNDHSQERAEDYVELVAELIGRQGEARAVDLARCLGISHVTVSRTLNRLQREGWIRTEPYRAIFLTPAGEKLAAEAKSRHEIVLNFLVAAGVPQGTANLDAEGIEHHVSPETLEVLRRLTARIGPGQT